MTLAGRGPRPARRRRTRPPRAARPGAWLTGGMEPTLPGPDPQWRPSAVVFDCDGVLMDTESAWARVQKRVAAGYGVAGESADRLASWWLERWPKRFP